MHSVDRHARELLLFRQRGECGLFVVFNDVGNELEVPVEHHNAARCAHDRAGWLVAARKLHRGQVVQLRRHLAGNEAAPDQRVQSELLGTQRIAQRLGHTERIGRADRFVRLLSIGV